MALELQHHEHQGFARRSVVHMPARPTIGIVLIHAAAGSPKSAILSMRWPEQDGVAVCAPEALPWRPDEPLAPENCRLWSTNQSAVADRTVDDEGFVIEVAEAFKAQLPPGVPLCLVGHSGGASLCFRVLANRRHPFDAAALFGGPWSKPVERVKRVPLLYMAADSDPIFPWHEVTTIVTPWFSYETEWVPDTIDAWRAATGLDEPARTETMRFTYGQRTGWRGHDGAAFDFVLLREHGHHWATREPVSPEIEKLFGRSNPMLNVTSLALDFLRVHTADMEPVETDSIFDLLSV